MKMVFGLNISFIVMLNFLNLSKPLILFVNHLILSLAQFLWYVLIIGNDVVAAAVASSKAWQCSGIPNMSMFSIPYQALYLPMRQIIAMILILQLKNLFL